MSNTESKVLDPDQWTNYVAQFGKRPRVPVEGSPEYHARLRRREPPRSDRWSPREERPFTFPDKEWMAAQAVANVRAQGHKFSLEVTDEVMTALASQCIGEIEQLHNGPDIIPHPPADIDAIWIISAPGSVTHKQGVKPGWSSEFPWMDNMEWEVVGSAFALALAVAAKRLGKPTEQVTKEDVQRHGPWLIYNSQPWEVEAIHHILAESPNLQIPSEKVLLYDEFVDRTGKTRTLVNTADQAESIRMPEGVQPRKLAICVLAAQWVRLGRLLAQSKTLPETAGVVVVPTLTPAGCEAVHAIMECQGTVINAFVNGKGALEPIQNCLS